MARRDREVHIVSQTAGGFVVGQEADRIAELSAALGEHGAALARALCEMEGVRDFIGTPEKILGNPSTKHGEIAEHVEVGVRRAWDYLHQNFPSATFEGVGRTAPEDYLIGGAEVQSKFINGVKDTLAHVVDHMRKYEHFGRDGSFYHIPRDQHEVIEKLLRGEAVTDLHPRTVQAIESKLSEIRHLAGGQPIKRVLQPSMSSYAEVQQDQIQQTLDQHKAELEKASAHKHGVIEAKHALGFGDVAEAAGKGALVGAGLRMGVTIFRKVTSEGKNPLNGDFTTDDWKDLGLEGLKGGTQGAISAGAIYALTQSAALSAPFAGAFVSSAMALTSLAEQWRSGELAFEEFVELGQLVCIEGAIVGLASAAGQALIPIPALGALLGAVGGRLFLLFGRKLLGDCCAGLERRLSEAHERRVAALDANHREALMRITNYFDTLHDLTLAAFDVNLNSQLLLEASINVARRYGVAEHNIIHNASGLDDFMLS